MNIYFLVEGDTEAIVYPKWLAYLAPSFERVDRLEQAAGHSYYLFNCGGYPSIHNHMVSAIQDINALGIYDKLVVSFDVDEEDVTTRIEKANQHLQTQGVQLERAELVYCLQDACIETWFMGNRAIFKRNPQNKALSDMIKFYDVYQDDPEQMTKPETYDGERQQFHKHYWKLLARERRMRYRETSPGDTKNTAFLENLQTRVRDTGHLPTLTHFFDFWQRMESQARR
jgi:hypothetical protein